ncbi:tetratricopeptide repeat protein [Streptomyces bobili]|uniref:tetratricopeptide repeat protein n=1 Tax=Streptomyces bobili TaxID=67280 RepID=UPI0034DE6686
MTPKAGGGRPWGPIRTENDAARRLAVLLRRHVDACGKTLAVLGAEINVSKAQTGANLAGKVPSREFVIALIRATVPPELRERRQQEALGLREQALHPAPHTPPGPSAAAGRGYAVELAAAQARQIETYDRLTRALEQQAEVERAKNNSDKLVMVLLNMIRQLDRRVADLVQERDHLRTRPGSEALEDAERKLARAEEQEKGAHAELQRAEEKQRQAEELQARVQDQLRQLTDELDRLRAGDTSSPLDALPALIEEPAEQPRSADPVGDDIDAVLARASAVNDEDNDTLTRVTSQLDDTTAEIVQDNPPDNVPSPESMSARHDLGISVGESGDRAQAVLLFTELVPDLIRVLGADHPHTLSARHNLGINAGESGDHAQAVLLFTELVPDLIRVLGADHPQTVNARHNLGISVGESGDRAQAVLLLTEVIPDLIRVLGADHPQTLNARHNLGISVGESGDRAQAVLLLTELVPDLIRVLGADHLQTLNARHNLGISVGESGDRAQAVLLLTELVPDVTRVLGADHPHTLKTFHLITNWHKVVRRAS